MGKRSKRAAEIAAEGPGIQFVAQSTQHVAYIERGVARVYSEQGDPGRTYGHDLSCITNHPVEPDTFVTCTGSGDVAQWSAVAPDATSALPLKSLRVGLEEGQQVVAVRVVVDISNHVFILLCLSNGSNHRVLRRAMDLGDDGSNVIWEGSGSRVSAFDASAEIGVLAMEGEVECRVFSVFTEIQHPSVSFPEATEQGQVVTAAACWGKRVVLGNKKGQIGSWNVGIATCGCIKHWHAHPVTVLAFSQDGSVVCSGGHEGVAVIWATSTWSKTKVPRLGGSILGLSMSPNRPRVVAAVGPATFRVIDTSMGKLAGPPMMSFVPFTKGADQTPPWSSVVSVPLRNSLVALLGEANTLRFFDPTKFMVLKDMAVIPQNVIAGVNSESLPRLQVKRALFTADQRWMVTYDTSDVHLNGVFTSSLKFWFVRDGSRQQAMNNFECCTTVQTPHGQDIVAMIPHPRYCAILTASADNTVKIWELQIDDKGNNFWRSGGSRLAPRPPSVADWMSCGESSSAILFGSGPTVEVWSFPKLDIVTRLSTLKEDTLITIVCGLKDGKTVVGAGKMGIFVWDLNSSALKWTVSTSVECMMAIPEWAGVNNAFGAIVKGVWTEYTADSEKPGYRSKAPVLDSKAESACLYSSLGQDGLAQWSVFVVGRRGEVKIHQPQSDSLLCRPGKESQGADPMEIDLPLPARAPVLGSIAPAFGAEQGAAGAPVSGYTPLQTVGQAKANFLFLEESHTIPPLHLMMETFMDNFLPLAP